MKRERESKKQSVDIYVLVYICSVRLDFNFIFVAM